MGGSVIVFFGAIFSFTFERVREGEWESGRVGEWEGGRDYEN
jgi:hypothetical protein